MCGKRNPDFIQVCGHCGRPLEASRPKIVPPPSEKGFKTCPKCGKKVRLVDNECWDCHSRAVALVESDAEVERKAVMRDNDPAAAALIQRCEQLYGDLSDYRAHRGDWYYSVAGNDAAVFKRMGEFRNALLSVAELRRNKNALLLLKRIKEHMTSPEWNRPTFNQEDWRFLGEAAKMALSRIEQAGHWVNGTFFTFPK